MPCFARCADGDSPRRPSRQSEPFTGGAVVLRLCLGAVARGGYSPQRGSPATSTSRCSKARTTVWVTSSSIEDGRV